MVIVGSHAMSASLGDDINENSLRECLGLPKERIGYWWSSDNRP